MMIKELSIAGFRGFSGEQKLKFGQPNGKTGSGLTVIVGPNNGGKSSVIESLEALSVIQPVTFSRGKRNVGTQKRVMLQATLVDGSEHILRTVDNGGSQADRIPSERENNSLDYWYVLPSRRFFSPRFGGGTYDRSTYLSQHAVPSHRSDKDPGFHCRIHNAQKNMNRFNEVLSKIVSPAPKWTIDRSDEGNYYIEIDVEGQYHDSDGAGDGIISLLFLTDALYDSSPGSVVAIDEPELSLHPAYQRRLAGLFAEYAKDRQLVYATHSPYFVDFECIRNGAEIARVHRENGSSVISPLDRETVNKLGKPQKNINNPHVLGSEARESFFQDDGVVVVEGQEDVVLYPLVLDQLEKQELLGLKERFFGWGAGGAENIGKILALLRDLGFRRVAAIYDKGKERLAEDLDKEFEYYRFYVIPACDVRTKENVEGLLDGNNNLRENFKEDTKKIFDDIGNFILAGS